MTAFAHYAECYEGAEKSVDNLYVADNEARAFFSGYRAATETIIPKGWQLVPIAPTEEMIDCGAQGMASFQEDSVWPDSWDATQVKGMRHDATKAYRYMLAAAPKYEE